MRTYLTVAQVWPLVWWPCGLPWCRCWRERLSLVLPGVFQ